MAKLAERVANLNQLGGESGGQITIEEIQVPPGGLATNQSQWSGRAPIEGAWALPTASTTSQPHGSASTNEQGSGVKVIGSESQYVDLLTQQQGYNFVSDQNNVQQRLMEVSGCLDQLARLVQHSGQVLGDQSSRVAALKQQLDFMDTTHNRRLDEILEAIRSTNEGITTDRNMLLSRVRRMTNLNNSKQEKEDDLMPPPSAVEGGRAPYRLNLGERNHSQRPSRMSSTGRDENQSSYHTVHQETGQRKQREPYGGHGT